MTDFLVRFFREEAGGSAIPYALMLALIAVGLIVSLKLIGTMVGKPFEAVAQAEAQGDGTSSELFGRLLAAGIAVLIFAWVSRGKPRW